jgi:hypothetical protein
MWIGDRLYWTIARATGHEPIVVFLPMHSGAVFIVGRDDAELHLDRVEGQFSMDFFPLDEKAVRTTSDNWPFLYLQPRKFPWGYLFVLLGVVVLAAVATPFAFGPKSLGSDFDPVLFLMGAAFLLVETRGVTTLALLFGSTWMVNSAVFTGVIVMVLAANFLVQRLGLKRPEPWFAALLASVVLLWLFKVGMLNAYPLVVRGLIGGLINALPIGFAGVIVSILLRRSANPTASLGSNLLGAVIGGCLEYLSMYLGLSALAGLALVIYLAALLWFLRRTEAASFAPSPSRA